MSESPGAQQGGVSPRLRLIGVSKRFGGVQALMQADFSLLPGEVHALVGENGAGKSTLIKIIAGAETMDSGTMELDGQPVQIQNASDAIALGIATVYQDAQLFGQLTVAENVFIGRELRRAGRIDWAAQNARLAPILETVGLPAECATRLLGDLSAAEAQQVAIAKALSAQARILILDEPSAILTAAEVEVLYQAIRRLVREGVSIVYITHRLDELFQIADVVTVMRDGRTLGTYGVADLDVRRVAELMVGEGFKATSETGTQARETGKKILAVAHLGSGPSFHDVTFEVREGEAVGVYGLVGSGVAEIGSAIYGMRRISSGRLEFQGRELHLRSAREAQRLGIAMLPEDRKREGLLSFQSILFNISIGHLRSLSLGGVWMMTRREEAAADRIMHRLNIRAPSFRTPVEQLSGGNAQKVVLGRQLLGRPRLLVLAEPTQGVDVAAKQEIHTIVDELLAAGTSVVIATSDLAEAVRIADRFVIIRNGTTFAEFPRGSAESELLAAAAGDVSFD